MQAPYHIRLVPSRRIIHIILRIRLHIKAPLPVIIINNLYFDCFMVNSWYAIVVILILVQVVLYFHRVTLINTLILGFLVLRYGRYLAASLLAATFIILLSIVYINVLA